MTVTVKNYFYDDNVSVSVTSWLLVMVTCWLSAIVIGWLSMIVTGWLSMKVRVIVWVSIYIS
jgi:hypothetical protein